MTALRPPLAFIHLDLLIVRMILVLAVTPLVALAGLDDPGQKKITVETEIERGMAAVDSIPPTLDALVLSDRSNKILALNQQQNTDTDGFRLGLPFEW